MSDTLMYLWYSAQHNQMLEQKNTWLSQRERRNPLIKGKLENGKEVYFSFQTEDDSAKGYNWPDKVLLGKGRYAGS